MRFDDSLRTVLAGDSSSGFGAQATWRQLVDLLGRRRAEADEPSIARLRLLRQAVPATIRAASARAVAFADPPAVLVGFFAEDELAIAAPVLRTARLEADEWLALLPRLTPSGRSVLRHRRDLPIEVVRGLASFGSVDFVLDHDSSMPAGLAEPTAMAVAELDILELDEAVVIETHVEAELSSPTPPGFDIPELVARIDAFTRTRAEAEAASRPEPEIFRYETDAAGAIRWVEGVARAPLIGVSIAHAAMQGLAQVDGVAAGGFRRRSRFADARLQIGGGSDAAGDWRLDGAPVFDPRSGRFTGFRGVGRRPRADEMAEPRRARAASESLRQLVHELRTPTNAISGFAELIETELLGPVNPVYRERAVLIRHRATELIAAIDDLDTAARIEGHALELRPTRLVLEPLLIRLVDELQPLAELRRARLTYDPAGPHVIECDDRAVERLIGRLLSALLGVTQEGERIGVWVEAPDAGTVAFNVDRPRALGAGDDGALLSIDADGEASEGAPLLGAGFALRLARNLAAELGGNLVIGADRLTLRLPAAVDRDVGQAIN